MRILKDELYLTSLQGVLYNIAIDSIDQAVIFDMELESKIQALPDMPFKFRQSFFHDDPEIRDLIYKGYVVPYLVDSKRDQIVILNIFTKRNYTENVT